MKILLVDDNKDSCKSTADFLRALGHDVVECGNGYEAIQLFLRQDFPLVLSETKMPHISGIELARILTTSGREMDMVLFTDDGDMEAAIEALRIGVYDCLIKPLDLKELASVVARVHERYMKRQKNQNSISILFFGKESIAFAGLKSIVQGLERFRIVGHYSDAEECINTIKKKLPDLVVLDFSPGYEKVMDCCRILKDEAVLIQAILFAAPTEKELAYRLVKKGELGLLLTSAGPEEALYVLYKAARGETAIDPAVMLSLNRIDQKTKDKRLQILNRQERQILLGLAQGKTNKQIAENLFLSPATVKNYLSNILHKLELPNRAAAIAFAINNLQALIEEQP